MPVTQLSKPSTSSPPMPIGTAVRMPELPRRLPWLSLRIMRCGPEAGIHSTSPRRVAQDTGASDLRTEPGSDIDQGGNVRYLRLGRLRGTLRSRCGIDHQDCNFAYRAPALVSGADVDPAADRPELLNRMTRTTKSAPNDRENVPACHESPPRVSARSASRAEFGLQKNSMY